MYWDLRHVTFGECLVHAQRAFLPCQSLRIEALKGLHKHMGKHRALLLVSARACRLRYYYRLLSTISDIDSNDTTVTGELLQWTGW